MQFNVGDRVRVVMRHDMHDMDWVRVGAEFSVTYVDECNPDHPIKLLPEIADDRCGQCVRRARATATNGAAR